MSIKWPPQLIQAIARRKSVILIGSGVSANAKNDAGKGPPTWGSFLGDAYSKLGRRVRHIAAALKSQNYLEACEYLKTEHGAEWPNLIRDSFVTPNFRPAEIHKSIFELDSRIVASLNFDKIYEIYAIQTSENTAIIKNYYDADVRQALVGNDRYILKPHGTVDTPSKMIFTLADYAKARVEHAPFYEMMTALLHTHTFLCIGCGLSDPDMKLIFEDYRYKYSECPHYILLPAPRAAEEIALIEKTRGLNVIKYSPKDGHAELSTGLNRLVSEVVSSRDAIAKTQNW